MTSSNNRKSTAPVHFFLFIALIISLPSFSQTHSFTSYSLVSGTSLAVNSVYRFTGVKTGTDALVTITALTGGVTVTALDNTGSGYAAAFQPTLHVPLGPNANGYAEFKIKFVVAGTSTLQPQTNIDITGLDIDGMIDSTDFLPARDSLFEYDMLDLGTGSLVDFSTLGQQIKVSNSGTQVTATNKTGINYPGINTTATDVMFSVLSTSIDSFTFRTGLVNKIPASYAPIDRVTSIYFGKFIYPSSALSISSLQNFSGHVQDNAVQLSWDIAPGSGLQDLQVERSVNGISFIPVKDFPAGVLATTGTAPFSFTDPLADGQTFYYRLKAFGTSGEAQYSTILTFSGGHPPGNTFRLYPTLVHNNASISFVSHGDLAASLDLFNYSGCPVWRRSLRLNAGMNNIRLDNLAGLPAGSYVVVLQTGNTSYMQKFVRQ